MPITYKTDEEWKKSSDELWADPAYLEIFMALAD
jgi:hypothetical protein